MNGIVVINKPVGLTSQQVVTKVKKALNQSKVGHLGTLDPLASGVLPICIGKATKLFDFYLKKTKTYVAEFTFGQETDTLDSEGQVIKSIDNIPTKQEILNNLPKLIGDLEQIPPKYSAKSVGGIRAYELSRKGIDFELKSKQISVYKFELLSQKDSKTFEFLIDCSSGTYIRSLARDLGYLCNSCAYMSGLNRIRSGEFYIENSVNLDNLTTSDIIPLEKVLEDIKRVDAPTSMFEKLKNGNEITFKSDDINQCLLYCDNKLFGIAHIKNNKAKVDVNLFDN